LTAISLSAIFDSSPLSENIASLFKPVSPFPSASYQSKIFFSG
jgi:hypothetical protein